MTEYMCLNLALQLKTLVSNY